MKKQHLKPDSHGVIIPPTPKLHLVKGGKKALSAIEANQADAIFEQLGISPPDEMTPDSSKTNNGEKSSEHLQAIKDVELFRAGKINATELRKRYVSTYTNWSGMKQRCRANPKTGKSPAALHPSLEKFADLLEILGPRPQKSWSIDRIDPTGPYSPDNVRWASKTTQSRNRTNSKFITYKGVRKHQLEWAEIYGVSPDTYRMRRRDGCTDEEIIEGKGLRGSSCNFSRDDWTYTPWPEGNELNWEKQYQRDKHPSECRLHFLRRYAQQRLHAIQEEIELLSIPDDEGIPSRTTAEQAKWDKRGGPVP
jgi:hypothetical protein